MSEHPLAASLIPVLPAGRMITRPQLSTIPHHTPTGPPAPTNAIWEDPPPGLGETPEEAYYHATGRFPNDD